MGKIKIYEIAKKLNLASKEVVEMAGKLNIEVKNHMSAVSEEDAEKIANKFNSKTVKEAKKREKTNKVEEESKKEKKTTKTEPKNPKKEEKAPVIIRREVIINEEENICIMINEEDHIRIQVFASGQELENLLNLAIELDEKIDGLVKYAVNKKYGYLTSCPTNVGTGLRASVMVHLPALTLTGNISKVLNVINNFGMNIRGIYGEGTQSQGNIYQISNNQSLGLTEKEIIKNIKTITEKVIEQERLARKYLAKRQIDLEDKVYRAYGILTNAKKVSSEECRKLLSDIKLGTDLGIIRELNDAKVSKLELYTKPGNLQKYLGKKLDAYERDIQRAKVIKQIINS